MKLVEVIKDPGAARLISDPMRRAILNLLRQRAYTEAELAGSLGLTDATVNYHLQILRKIGFVTVVRREEEEHGIMQKFYASTSFLYLPDVGNLPRDVARYYYPINVERVRGVLGATLGATRGNRPRVSVDDLGEELARELVNVAKDYADKTTKQGEGESLVNKIYSDALSRMGLGRQSLGFRIKTPKKGKR